MPPTPDVPTWLVEWENEVMGTRTQRPAGQSNGIHPEANGAQPTTPACGGCGHTRHGGGCVGTLTHAKPCDCPRRDPGGAP